jgi:formate dehydrogenase subunit gamma
VHDVIEGHDFEAFSVDRATQVVALHEDKRGPLIVMLHALQETFGYVDSEVVPVLAETLNISRAEVHGVITFYKDFRATPPGRSVIKVCRAESCQSMGAEALVEHAERRLGVPLGETTADGRFTLEQVFCLGNCALAPAIMKDSRLIGRVDEARFDALVTEPAGAR